MSTPQIIIATLIVYKLGLLAVGFWASRRVKTEGDYFLAGQGLGAWTAGLSYAASTSSAWVLLGFTGAVWASGLSALWLLPGIFGGYLLTWLVMGPRLNAETSLNGHITIIDFLTHGVDPKWKRVIGIVCALMILFCFVFYISSQFKAAGDAFISTFNLSAAEAILLGAVIIVIYCLFGGFWAASITDAFQAAVMLLACIIVPVAAVNAAGGLSNVMDTLHAGQSKTYFDFLGGAPGMLGLGAAMGLMGTGLGALGQPQLLNRIMATKDPAARRRGAAITIGWGLVIYSGLVVLAMSVRSMELITDPALKETIFFKSAETFLPAILAGIVIAAVLSAVMSTVDSLLLAAASAISRDMGFTYKSPSQALLAGRIAMVIVAALAVALALFAPKDIFTRVLFAWVALGAAFGPALLTKCLGCNVRGGYILAAIMTGFVIAVGAYNFGKSADLQSMKIYAGLTEKWLSWMAGLAILYLGRKKS
jgi:sodium/proline symporter